MIGDHIDLFEQRLRLCRCGVGNAKYIGIVDDLRHLLTPAPLYRA